MMVVMYAGRRVSRTPPSKGPQQPPDPEEVPVGLVEYKSYPADPNWTGPAAPAFVTSYEYVTTAEVDDKGTNEAKPAVTAKKYINRKFFNDNLILTTKVVREASDYHCVQCRLWRS